MKKVTISNEESPDEGEHVEKRNGQRFGRFSLFRQASDIDEEKQKTPRGIEILRRMLKDGKLQSKDKANLVSMANEFNEMTQQEIVEKKNYQNKLDIFANTLMSEQKKRLKEKDKQSY
jgi:hypothetical protein